MKDNIEKEAEEAKEQQQVPAAAIKQQQVDDEQYDTVPKTKWCTKENVQKNSGQLEI